MSKYDSDCPFFNGMNLGQAESIARRQLGADIRPGHRNGHHVARHPLMTKPCTFNGRKKSASREFVRWCRVLWQLVNEDHSRWQEVA